MDLDQQRAFQLIVSMFVLTYYDEASIDCSEQTRSDFNRNKNNLEILSLGNTQLVLFLSGAGGSGKSEVIVQVMLYCSEFCKNLNVEFTSSTIRITALTGVAATLIGGETIHSAAKLRATTTDFDEAFCIDWKKTRLLIIDEISFSSTFELIKLDQNLRRLRNKFGKKFGGTNIIFSGDFSQLEPVGEGNSLIYAEGHARDLWHNAVNCYIELKGLHTLLGVEF